MIIITIFSCTTLVALAILQLQKDIDKIKQILEDKDNETK